MSAYRWEIGGIHVYMQVETGGELICLFAYRWTKVIRCMATHTRTQMKIGMHTRKLRQVDNNMCMFTYRWRQVDMCRRSPVFELLIHSVFVYTITVAVL